MVIDDSYGGFHGDFNEGIYGSMLKLLWNCGHQWMGICSRSGLGMPE